MGIREEVVGIGEWVVGGRGSTACCPWEEIVTGAGRKRETVGKVGMQLPSRGERPRGCLHLAKT